MPDPAVPAVPAAPAAAPVVAPTAPATPAVPAPAAAPVVAQSGAVAPAIPAALAAMLPATPAVSTPPVPSMAAPTTAPETQAPATAPKLTAEEQVASLRADLNTRTVRDFVTEIATTAGAISPEQVVKLLRDELDVASDGRVSVRSDPRADAKQHVARFLAGNLHMLKPTLSGGGAGSGPVQAPQHVALDPHSREGGTAVVHNFLGRIFRSPATVPGTPGVSAAPLK